MNEIATRGAARPLRVAFSIDSMHVGGTEMNAVRTAEHLVARGVDLRVICLRNEGPLRERYAAAGVPVYEFPVHSLYSPRSIRQGVALARFLRDEQVDVLHAHDMYSNIFAVPWARMAGVRGVIGSRRWWYNHGGGALDRANRLGYAFAHAVLANSPAVGQFVIDRERIDRGKVTIVSNFVDEAAFAAPTPAARRALLADLGVPDSGPLIGIVANLNPVKDHDSLLRAFATPQLRETGAHLVLVGDGTCRAELEALSQRLELANRVVFAGRRPHNPNLHHLFDISVLCSVSEGLSNSLLEAMAAANPIVATDVGATADAVVHGETGILVPSRNPGALSSALLKLLADPARAMRMGAAGRDLARREFSAPAAVARLEELYSKLTSHREHAGSSGVQKTVNATARRHSPPELPRPESLSRS